MPPIGIDASSLNSNGSEPPVHSFNWQDVQHALQLGSSAEISPVQRTSNEDLSSLFMTAPRQVSETSPTNFFHVPPLGSVEGGKQNSAVDGFLAFANTGSRQIVPIQQEMPDSFSSPNSSEDLYAESLFAIYTKPEANHNVTVLQDYTSMPVAPAKITESAPRVNSALARIIGNLATRGDASIAPVQPPPQREVTPTAVATGKLAIGLATAPETAEEQSLAEAAALAKAIEASNRLPELPMPTVAEAPNRLPEVSTPAAAEAPNSLPEVSIPTATEAPNTLAELAPPLAVEVRNTLAEVTSQAATEAPSSLALDAVSTAVEETNVLPAEVGAPLQGIEGSSVLTEAAATHETANDTADQLELAEAAPTVTLEDATQSIVKPYTAIEVPVDAPFQYVGNSLRDLNEKYDNNESRYSRTLRPDGTAVEVQTAADFSAMTKTANLDGSNFMVVHDKYRRPLFEQSTNADGTWSFSEIRYHDQNGRINPFPQEKLSVYCDGSMTRFRFSSMGLEASKDNYPVG